MMQKSIWHKDISVYAYDNNAPKIHEDFNTLLLVIDRKGIK